MSSLLNCSFFGPPLWRHWSKYVWLKRGAQNIHLYQFVYKTYKPKLYLNFRAYQHNYGCVKPQDPYQGVFQDDLVEYISKHYKCQEAKRSFLQKRSQFWGGQSRTHQPDSAESAFYYTSTLMLCYFEHCFNLFFGFSIYALCLFLYLTSIEQIEFYI